MKAIAAYVAKHKLRSLGTVLLITGLGISGWILFEHQTKLQVAAPEPVFSRDFGKVRHVLADGTVRSEIEFSRESLPDFEELFPEVYQRLTSHAPIAREGEHYQLELAIGKEGAPSRWGMAWVVNGAEFWSNGDATFEVRGSVRDHLVHAWTWRTLKVEPKLSSMTPCGSC